jgi:hypothetical protein
MTQLHRIPPDPLNRPERLLDVVFVHGAGGDYLNSWGLRRQQEGGEADSMLHWLLGDADLSGLGVWSLQHESDKFWTGQQGSLTRKELAQNVLAELMRSPLLDPASPQSPRRPICWVAHSEGGNVVKQLLYVCQLECAGDLNRAKPAAAAAILEATKAVYFIDTPHRGSWVAGRLGRLIPGLRQRVHRELREADDELRDLHAWYVRTMVQRMQNLNFRQGKEFFSVVGTASAELEGVIPVAISRDHNRIAKPENRDDSPYREIKDDLLRIHQECRATAQLQAPVPSVPLRVQRVGCGDAHEPLRLLCFVVPELGAFDPAMASRQGKQFRLMFWLTEADGLPKALDQAWIEGLRGDQLTAEIGRVYAEQLNDSPSGRLLLALFLPFDLLASDRLEGFVDALRLHTCEQLPHCTGVPVVLGCSSRWPVGCSAHPRLGMTRHSLRRASERVVRTLFQDPGPQAANLGCLDWLMITAGSPSPSSAPLAGRPIAKPAAIASILAAEALGQGQSSAAAGRDGGPGDADEAPDPLADCVAVYLSESAERDRGSGGQGVLEPLLLRGIPLIWRANPLACEARAQPVEGGHGSDPMDSILAWDGLSFLDHFYRYRLDPASPADQTHGSIRAFIRHSTLFWEDHRHIPTEPSDPPEAPARQGAAIASANPFYIPFQASPP